MASVQAGQVRGEAVRTCVDFPWFICDMDMAYGSAWVEVRAPRALAKHETMIGRVA